MTTDVPRGRPARAVVLTGAGIVLLVAAGLFGVLRAMAGPEGGPLRLPQGYGVAMSPTSSGTFVTVPACSTTESVEVTIRRVEALRLEGTDAVHFRVAWPSEEEPAKIGAGRLPVPEMYGEAEGATGTLVRCHTDPQRQLDIAVLLPRATTAPVFLHGFAVTYEAEGRTFRSVTDATLGICVAQVPAGAPSADRCSED